VIVALTHSIGRLAGLEDALRALGFQVFHHPLVQIETVRDANIAPLVDCPWWLVTSISSVEALLEMDVPLSGRSFGAVGEATAQALRRAGARVELVGPGTALDLGELFLERVNHGPVGLPLGDHALPTLRVMLENAGLEMRAVTVYRNRVQGWPDGAPTPDLVVLASPSAASALPLEVARRTRLIALGPSTAERLHSLGLECLTASEPTVQAVLDLLETERTP
jgi:uroporphyrinogen-III synthase